MQDTDGKDFGQDVPAQGAPHPCQDMQALCCTITQRKSPSAAPPRLHRRWLFTLALSQEFGISVLCYI